MVTAGSQVTTAFNAGAPAYACANTSATYVEFLLSTTMTANVVGTVGTCQATVFLSFTVTQDGTGGRAWSITNFDKCPILQGPEAHFALPLLLRWNQWPPDQHV